MRVPFTTTTIATAALVAIVWSSNVIGTRAAIGCPCVQDLVTFQFDLALGCAKNIINPSDFTRTSCTVNDSSNSRVKKVVIHDHQSATSSTATITTLPVFLASPGGETVNKAEVVAGQTSSAVGDMIDASASYYYFQYQRSAPSPSVLFIDVFSSSNKLMASIDLYYATSNRNCVVSSSPIYWPGDTLYFLTVVRFCFCLLFVGCCFLLLVRLRVAALSSAPMLLSHVVVSMVGALTDLHVALLRPRLMIPTEKCTGNQ